MKGKMPIVNESTARTWILVLAPLVVAAGFFARPYVSDFTNNELMAAAINDLTGQWIAAGLLMVAGAVLLAFALPAAVRRVDGGEARERRVQGAAIIGASLLALQVGLSSLGAAAASRIGADVVEFRDAMSGLEIAVLMVGLLALLIAWIGVIRAVWASALPTSIKWIVTVGGVLGALGHLYPGSPGEYAASVGTAAGLWVLAVQRPGSVEG